MYPRRWVSVGFVWCSALAGVMTLPVTPASALTCHRYETQINEAHTGRLVCASCDPTGARPNGVQVAGSGNRLFQTTDEPVVGTWMGATLPPRSSYDPDYQSRLLS